jgi:hypothetical protein
MEQIHLCLPTTGPTKKPTTHKDLTDIKENPSVCCAPGSELLPQPERALLTRAVREGTPAEVRPLALH